MPEIPRLFHVEKNTDTEHWISQYHTWEKKKNPTTGKVQGDYESKMQTSNAQAIFVVVCCFM